MRRSKAFSGKQKKQQLKDKRERKHVRVPEQNFDQEEESAKFVTKPEENLAPEGSSSSKFFESAPVRGRGECGSGRYALKFRPESKAEIEKLKAEARKTIHPVQEEYLECSIEEFYTPQLDFPLRPPWNSKLSREAHEANEQKYFENYLKRIDENFERSELSYFELNLETWRQLWRVIEMSDILLCIVDIRYPALLFPPKLYEYAVKVLGKNIILVLNKIDLCSSALVLAWREYFKKKYPEIDILCFTSFPDYNLHGNLNEKSIMKGKKKRARMKMAAEGALEVFKACDKIVNGQVDLSKWKEKIMDEMNDSSKTEGEEEDEGAVEIGSVDTQKPDTGYFEFQKYGGGVLTIGTVGQPNVGKSSLINGLMGKKVVSVSKTPGHTKHFQTIFLTPNVRLCDCPGLIFPSRVPKPLQVLSGSYPIAQLREPFSTVKYLAERMDLIHYLRISHPEGEIEWSAYDISDGWASKRGFYTAKASRLDSYRAANQILRLALEGRLPLCLRPPNYSKDKGIWEKDPRKKEIDYIQAKSDVGPKQDAPLNFEDISDEEEEEEHGEVKGKRKVGFEGVPEQEDSNSSEEEEEEEGASFKFQNKFALLNDDDD